MAREQFRAPPNARLQQPAEPSDLLGNDVERAQAAPEWLELPEYAFETFPYNGAPIAVCSEEGQIAEAVWRSTRAFDMKTGVWAFKGFWARRNFGGQKLGFEPMAYRKIEE